MGNDAELSDWNGLMQGDENAFMRLYEAHYQALFSFGFRIYPDKDLVKDTIHEVFCELWDKRYQLPSVQNVKAYLMTFLKRRMLKELEKKYIALPEDHVHALLFERSYEDILIEQQTSESSRLQLQKSLERLTPTQLEIIRLKYYELMNYEEIASQLQLQPRTIYNQISEALKTLRFHLKVLTILFFLLF